MRKYMTSNTWKSIIKMHWGNDNQYTQVDIFSGTKTKAKQLMLWAQITSLMIGNKANTKCCHRHCFCRITIRLAKTNAPKTNSRKLYYVYIVQWYTIIFNKSDVSHFGLAFLVNNESKQSIVWTQSRQIKFMELETLTTAFYQIEKHSHSISILPMDNDKRALKPLFKIRAYN